jgi:hypothetical protein
LAGVLLLSRFRTSAIWADAGSSVVANTFDEPTVLVMVPLLIMGVLALENCQRICLV